MANPQFQITSADEFRRLRLSDDPAEYGVAADGWAEESVWLEVIERFPDLKLWVAHNKPVLMSILDILARDEDRRVRGMVAGRRKLSRELFELLANDPDAGIRESLVGNAKIPLDILERLTKDRSKYVRARAKGELELRLKKLAGQNEQA